MLVTLSCGLTTYQGHWETSKLVVAGNLYKSLEITGQLLKSFEMFLEIQLNNMNLN